MRSEGSKIRDEGCNVSNVATMTPDCLLDGSNVAKITKMSYNDIICLFTLDLM